jgi:hypothetical protein
MTKTGRERRKQARVYATRARRLREEEALEKRLRMGRREINWRELLPEQIEGPLLSKQTQQRFEDALVRGENVFGAPDGSEREKLVAELFAGALSVQQRRRMLGFA